MTGNKEKNILIPLRDDPDFQELVKSLRDQPEDRVSAFLEEELNVEPNIEEIDSDED